MEQLVSGISLVMERRDSRHIIILCATFLLLFLLAIQNGGDAFTALSFSSLPLWERTMIALRAFFDFENTFTPGTLLLSVLGSFLGGVNFSLAFTYIKLRGEVIVRSGLYSGIGLFFAFIGIGCAACGTALLSIILGFFGFSAMLSLLPYQGQEIGYIGLIILLIATYTLARKVAGPNVC